MLTIGICDDEQTFVDELSNLLVQIMFQYADWNKVVFHSGEEVIEAIEKNKYHCDILFMDIFMKECSGVDVAKYIACKHIDTDIIFVTKSQEYVFECYRYNTFAYLLKPLNSFDIEKEIKRYFQEMALSPKTLTISFRGVNQKIQLNSILYFESDKRKVLVHTTKGVYSYYERLDALENMLREDGFIRCHQSYLVSKRKISYYGTGELMVGDVVIPISRRYQDGLKRQLSNVEMESHSVLSTTLTRSLAQNREKTGDFVCIKGEYLGAIIHIEPEQKIKVGRDGTVSDLVINLPLVSRLHCEVVYHLEQDEYEIVDVSSNGTFVNGATRLIRGERYLLKPGTELSFGDKNTIYKLG